MMLSVPRKRPAMYSRMPRCLFPPGRGPFGLALDESPFPLATSNCLPSWVTLTEVGYHPTGMKPNDRLCPGVLTSKTATSLLSALATNNKVSSGLKSTLFGVEPGGAFGERDENKVS